MSPCAPPTRPFASQFAAVQEGVRGARTARDWQLRKSYQWLVALGAGLATGVLAFVMNYATEALQWGRYYLTERHIDANGGFWVPWLAYTGMAILYASVAGLLVSRVSPISAGSGIPQMRSWINGVDVPRAVAPATLAVKASGVVLAIASGLVAGKEGPYIHCGGVVGYLVGCSGDAWARRWARHQLMPEAVGGASGPKEGAAAPAKPPPKPARRSLAARARAVRGAALRALSVVEPREASDYASVGTSGGVAVAFNAPVAGVAYAAEEGNTIYSVAMLWRAVLAAASAIFSMQLLTWAVRARRGLPETRLTLLNSLSYRDTAHVWSTFWYHIWEVPLLTAFGVVTGLLGALWTALCVRLLKLRARWIPQSKPLWRNIEVAVVAAITATVWGVVCYWSPCAPLPETAKVFEEGNGRHFTPETFQGPSSMWPQLWCQDDNTFSTWGQLFAMPLEGAVRALMSAQLASSGGEVDVSGPVPGEEFDFSIETLALFAVCAFGGLLLAYGIAAPTGIFIPTMAIGGAVGRLAGRGVQAALTAAGVDQQVSLPTWAAVGAAGLLAGNTRLLLSTVLIVTETTGSGPALVPIILACVVAKLVADAINCCVYDFQAVHQMGLPCIEDKNLLHPGQLASLLGHKAEDAAEAFATLPPCPRVQDLIDFLQRRRDSLVAVMAPAGGATESSGGCGGAAAPSDWRDAVAAAADRSAGSARAPGSAAAAQVQPQGAEPAADGLVGGCGGRGQLLGVVYRWQLLSCLEHPALLRLLLLAPGAAPDGTAPDAGGAAAAAPGAAAAAPVAAAGPVAVSATAACVQAGAGSGGGGSWSGADKRAGGGARSAEDAAGADAVTLDVPAAPLLGALSGSAQHALITLLAQGPPNETHECAAAREQAVLRRYLGGAGGAGDAGGSGGGCSGGAGGPSAGLRRRKWPWQRAGKGTQGGGGGSADGGASACDDTECVAEQGRGSDDSEPQRDAERRSCDSMEAGAPSNSAAGELPGEAAAAAPPVADAACLLERRVDLSPLCHRCPPSLPPDAPLEYAYEMMRQLGVHSVLVARADASELVGVVTREELLRAAEG